MRKPATMNPLRHVNRWFKADELLNHDRGWTYNLAIFRVVFLGVGVLPFAWDVIEWTDQVMPGLPKDAWVPISFYRYLPFDFISNVALAHWLSVANFALLGLGLLGVRTRWTLGAAAILSLYVFGLPQNQGKVDHYHHIIWFLTLLAIGPSGRLLSMDSLAQAVRSADRGRVDPIVPRSDALGTLRCAWILLGLLYLIPGLAKLEKAITAGWASADNLRAVLWLKWFEIYLYEPGFQLPLRIDLVPPPMLVLAGLGVILLEAGFIALVLFRPARPLLALSGLAFHIGNGLFLHIWFTDLMVAYVCLFDWTSMGRTLSKRLGRAPLLVLYDGGCRLCRRAMALLRSIDLFDDLEPVVGMSNDPRRLRYPHITDEMLAHDLFVVDSANEAGGYDAYRRIAAHIPFLWPIAPLMGWSPIARVGSRIYRRIADSRACSLVDRQPAPAATRAPGPHAVRWLCILLVLFQAGISGLLFSSYLARRYLPKGHKIPEALLAFSWREPVWPFDLYPTFSDTPGEFTDVWEARVALPDGREVGISRSAYAAAFGHTTKCLEITHGIMRERDPARQRSRSLDLVRTLWRHEPPEVRQAATGVKIYHATYRINPTDRAVVVQNLIHTFPVDLISPR